MKTLVSLLKKKKSIFSTATQNITYFHLIYGHCGSLPLEPTRNMVSWLKCSDLFLITLTQPFYFSAFLLSPPDVCKIVTVQS